MTDILREADAIRDKFKYSEVRAKVIRERQTEEWVRQQDTSELVERIHWLEDDADDKERRLEEAEEKASVFESALKSIVEDGRFCLDEHGCLEGRSTAYFDTATRALAQQGESDES